MDTDYPGWRTTWLTCLRYIHTVTRYLPGNPAHIFALSRALELGSWTSIFLWQLVVRWFHIWEGSGGRKRGNTRTTYRGRGGHGADIRWFSLSRRWEEVLQDVETKWYQGERRLMWATCDWWTGRGKSRYKVRKLDISFLGTCLGTYLSRYLGTCYPSLSQYLQHKVECSCPLNGYIVQDYTCR